MTETISNIQFLRPAWLLVLPILWLLQMWWHKRSSSGGWAGHIDADKIEVLRINTNRSRIHSWLVFSASMLTCLALAGPSLHALPGKVAGNRQAMVILFDLSPSMLARDVAPSRLDIARFKLIDLLRRRTDGETALIAYAGDAHRVSPLTDDHAVIENLVHTLHPEIMPVQGNQPEIAVALALELFTGAELEQGDIVFITDGMPEEAAMSINTALPDSYRVSVLAVGTEDGAPIPLVDSGFLLDQNNNMVMARLDASVMENLAANHNGRFATNTVGDADIDHLSGLTPLPFRARVKGEFQTFDRQHDAGYWLVLLMIPIALYGFRRHVLWIAIPAVLVSPESQAFDWNDLWRTKNQQAAVALQREDYEQAQLLFADPKWKAVAAFKNGDYTVAAKLLEHATTADDYYNLGTALAAAGNFERSIEALDQALALYGNPDTHGFADALLNRSLVLKWIEQQQESATDEESSDRDTNSDSNDESAAESDDGDDDVESDSDAAPADQPSVGGAVGAGNTLDQTQLEQQGSSGSRQDIADDETSDSADDATAVNEPGSINSANNINGFDANSGAAEIENNNNRVLNPYSEQWLRTLPQDPGGFMRRKFQHQTQTRSQAQSVESLSDQNKLNIEGLRY